MSILFRKISLLITLVFLSINPIIGSAYSNNVIHWGIPKAGNENIPDPGAELKDVTKKNKAFYLGDVKNKHIYLTFDCGYENGQTDKILKVLRNKKVPAAFFVTGQYLKSEPGLVKRIAKEGHTLGNHTWHHPNLTTVNKIRFQKELALVKSEIGSLTGVTHINYMRPPEGVFSEKTLKWANELGYTHVFWSMAYKDWEINSQKGADYAYQQIMSRVHPGAIILLHSVSSDNADALEKVIDDLRKKGYIFKSLDDFVIQQHSPNPFLFQ
ncbi:MAG: delta-lactam-biosynthetic de-N-acetylase [Bacillales bacterium]|jgi:peptidoglycan-N-acetylmuramic acid deacetylase|nr:delta-lactam-biosynthetic de-N-acetylase [Bacillales bacterium]